MKDNPLKEKSYIFALDAIRLYKDIASNQKEYVLTKQFLRSATSIGSAIEEANQAESTADFIHKLSIANKEANESRYWLRLLHDSGYINQKQCTSMVDECEELIKMLTSSINTSKSKRP